MARIAGVTFSLTIVPNSDTNRESRSIEGAFPEGMPQGRERAAVPAGGIANLHPGGLENGFSPD